MSPSVLLFVLTAAGLAAGAPETQKAVFAGGCFWGVDAVFRHVQGVVGVVSGYAGGDAGTAEYDLVSTGRTGHAEAVEVTYDPQQISYAKLLEIFFTVAHDPTQLNRQGPDVGTQYRSAVFYADGTQRQTASDFIKRLTRANAFAAPIVTAVVPLVAFYPAESYHQDYLAHHLTQPYIVYNDLPKLDRLKERFPALYRP
ncbi:MAG: peptide-methionine (S)-S-oxide reductase MsrA [Gemmatimonadales bacterium]